VFSYGVLTTFKMDLNGDELLLSNIARLLSSEKDASVISTCEFLETVVIPQHAAA